MCGLDVDAACVAQLLQALQQGFRRLEDVAAVQQAHAGCLALFGQFHGAGHGGFVAAVHYHVAPGHIQAGGEVLVVQLGAHKALDAVHLERAWHEGAHACGDEHAAGQQLCAL